jgi:hypothetical protein
MPNNHTQEICECYQQAAHCVQQAETQNDPKIKKQFLELTRRWLVLAHGLTDPSGTPSTATQAEPDRADNQRLMPFGPDKPPALLCRQREQR